MAVEILPKSHWTCPSSVVTTAATETEDDNDDDDSKGDNVGIKVYTCTAI